MKVAVIVTTYNWPMALQAVLQAYSAQTDQDFELLVADDGSTSETANLIKDFQLHAHFPIRHVWHADQGFRAAAIRNRALAQTTADYIIFSDGDCVPPRDFVASHRRLAEHGYFLSGNRVLLSQNFTQQILKDHLPIHQWSLSSWLKAWRANYINRFIPLLRLPNSSLRKISSSRWQGAKTCNLSAYRTDLLTVNGFDESYTGWGFEDSDLIVRLIRSGVKNKSARFSATVFHLWHKENDRSSLVENSQRLVQIIAAEYIRARQGVDQYSSDAKSEVYEA